jgi:hypothetical protein
VKEGDERSAVFQLFRNDRKFVLILMQGPVFICYILDGVISEPSYREYILYSACKDMPSNDRILPQRQYSIVKDNEIRIMDMQTTDTLYF